MIVEPKVSLFDLVMSLSEALDLVHPALFNHHMRVAYIALAISNELGMEEERQSELVMAGMLHDCGIVYVKDILPLVDFEINLPDENIKKHSEAGYKFLKEFDAFAGIADIIRLHHVYYGDKDKKTAISGKEAPAESDILHIADRIAVLIKKDVDIFAQKKNICGQIKEKSSGMFMPELTNAFMNLADKEYFWLDITSHAINSVLSRRVRFRTIDLDLEKLVELTKLFSRIIDFRSSFTATHSSGVAAVAEELARGAGYSDTECKMVRVAGYLHDLGKLAVPAEILEKASKLTEDEFAVIKRHPYHTYRILERVPALDVINTWASYHHELLDGTGYPFHLKEPSLSFESRIMAAAEFFTAATEDLPYRNGLSGEEAVNLIRQKASEGKIDPQITDLLGKNFEEINYKRIAAEKDAAEEYRKFAA